MPTPNDQFDRDSVRADWDRAAEAYTRFQAAGHDYYRLQFFGPAQVAVCGDVAGLQLLDAGCGNGYFAREMASRGARVLGVDLSPEMIHHAQAIETERPLGIDYRVLDAAEIGNTFEPECFDMATSCMGLQDMPEIPRVLAGIAHVLKPGARFVSCVPHPASDMRHREWVTDDNGRRIALALGGYFEEGPLSYDWSSERLAYAFTTSAYHAPLERWFEWIFAAGFDVRGFHEPQPAASAVAAHPDLHDAGIVPYFLIFDIVRRARSVPTGDALPGSQVDSSGQETPADRP